MIAQDWVYFFLTVSVLSLIVAFFSARQATGADIGTPDTQKIPGAFKARR